MSDMIMSYMIELRKAKVRAFSVVVDKYRKLETST